MRLSTKWLIVVLLVPLNMMAQTITMQQAYDSARVHYPNIKQKQLVQQASNINIANLSKGYLPQLTLSGQATYQSDVTQVNVPIPGINIPSPSKDQYKLLADVNQVVYDGGIIKQQQNLQQFNSTVEDQKLEVELYKLKERIYQVYMSILYVDEQVKQVELVKADLNVGINRVQAQVDNGTAFKSNLNMLKAELIKTNQRTIELDATRKGLIDVLSLFLNRPLDHQVQLVKPSVDNTGLDITRPELKLYQDQSILMQQQSKLIDAKNQPKASVFVQGGYGRPGLNMLDNSFSLYGIGGVRVAWSLGGLYTAKKEKELIHIGKQQIDAQKETFLLNTNTQVKQQQAEINKLNELVKSDAELIVLRKSVKDAANAQLENGVIAASDYVREVNAEDQARQSLITHQLQLLQAQVILQTLLGK